MERFNYHGPWDPRLESDLDNPHRRALLLQAIQTKTRTDHTFEALPEFLFSLIDAVGTAIVNAHAKKKSHLKKSLFSSNPFNKNKSREVDFGTSQNFRVPDPNNPGQWITVKME